MLKENEIQLYLERRKPENDVRKGVKKFTWERRHSLGINSPLSLLSSVGGNFLFRCNYDVNPLCLKGPPTYILS